jgi:hypothetical protein
VIIYNIGFFGKEIGRFHKNIAAKVDKKIKEFDHAS